MDSICNTSRALNNLDWKGPLKGSGLLPLLKAGPGGADCSWLCLVKFWIFPRMEFSHISEPLFSRLTSDLIKKKNKTKHKTNKRRKWHPNKILVLWCEVVGAEDLTSLPARGPLWNHELCSWSTSFCPVLYEKHLSCRLQSHSAVWPKASWEEQLGDFFKRGLLPWIIIPVGSTLAIPPPLRECYSTCFRV